MTAENILPLSCNHNFINADAEDLCAELEGFKRFLEERSDLIRLKTEKNDWGNVKKTFTKSLLAFYKNKIFSYSMESKDNQYFIFTKNNNSWKEIKKRTTKIIELADSCSFSKKSKIYTEVIEISYFITHFQNELKDESS